MPDFEHVISFHIMLDGGCWAQLADESQPAIRLETGDAVLFVGGDAHFMSTEPGERSTPNMDLYYRPKDRPLPFVLQRTRRHGPKLAVRLRISRLRCAAVQPDPRRAAAHPAREGAEWLRPAHARPDPCGAAGNRDPARRRRDDLVEAHRAHVPAGGAPAYRDLAGESTGWLAALRDRTSAPRCASCTDAGGALDARFVAREVGLSRSVFAERFARIMGVPAMHYLATGACSSRPPAPGTAVSIAQAAAEVGYESEAAFNRAFKKQVGVPPGAWRRARASTVARA